MGEPVSTAGVTTRLSMVLVSFSMVVAPSAIRASIAWAFSSTISNTRGRSVHSVEKDWGTTPKNPQWATKMWFVVAVHPHHAIGAPGWARSSLAGVGAATRSRPAPDRLSSTTVIGFSKPSRLRRILAGLSAELTPELFERLEELLPARANWLDFHITA